ncbi:MAG: hypothetical protein ACKO2G_11540 [Verrucomicrobiales bacterium]
MSFLSKFFDSSEPEPTAKAIPDGATSRDVIRIAVKSVVEQAGGNCATLEFVDQPDMYLQIMDCTINAHYPHEESPESLFPWLTNHPLVAGLEGFEAGSYMTVSLNEMNESEIVAWIEQYSSKVLSVDLHSTQIGLRMEQI